MRNVCLLSSGAWPSPSRTCAQVLCEDQALNACGFERGHFHADHYYFICHPSNCWDALVLSSCLRSALVLAQSQIHVVQTCLSSMSKRANCFSTGRSVVYHGRFGKKGGKKYARYTKGCRLRNERTASHSLLLAFRRQAARLLPGRFPREPGVSGYSSFRCLRVQKSTTAVDEVFAHM